MAHAGRRDDGRARVGTRAAVRAGGARVRVGVGAGSHPEIVEREALPVLGMAEPCEKRTDSRFRYTRLLNN